MVNIIDESKLIFWTGAPGSRWSGVAKQICTCSGVDNSDRSGDRSYRDESHFGNYFGPGMEFGDQFLDMSKLSKESVLEELNEPYDEPQNGRVRILKSHMFSRNLVWIKHHFPESKIVSVYRPSLDCLDWWLEAGGFDITYPNYEFYRDDILGEIAIESEGIVGFHLSGNYDLKPYDINTLVRKLGLSNPQDLNDSWGSKINEVLIGVYDPNE